MTDRKEYLDYRKQATQDANDEIGKFDRQLLLLAAGAIALSVTYSEKLMNPSEPQFIFLLVASWVSFFLTVTSILASHYCSNKSAHFDIKQIDEAYESGKVGNWSYNHWNFKVEIANIISFLMFCIGAACLLFFAYLNLGRISQMPKDDKTQTRSVFINDGRTRVAPPKPLPTQPTTSSKPQSETPPTEQESPAIKGK